MKMSRFQMSAQEREAIRTAAGTTKDETVRRRLNVLLMRCDGYTVREIAERTGLQIDSIFKMCQRYREEGLESFATNKYGGNHRALSEEQERRILSRFEKAAVAGQPVQAMEIKAAFDQARGRETGCGYIYMLLKRHGWRRVTEKSTSAHAPPRAGFPKRSAPGADGQIRTHGIGETAADTFFCRGMSDGEASVRSPTYRKRLRPIRERSRLPCGDICESAALTVRRRYPLREC